MKNLIRKILREEFDEWDWLDIGTTFNRD